MELLEEINKYNNNLKKSIKMRQEMQTNAKPPKGMSLDSYNTALESALDILVFEQKHLQKIIDRHTL